MILIGIIIAFVLYVMYSSNQPIHNKGQLAVSEAVKSYATKQKLTSSPSPAAATDPLVKKMTTYDTAPAGTFKASSYATGNRYAESAEVKQFSDNANPFKDLGLGDSFSGFDESKTAAEYIPGANTKLTEEDKFNNKELLPAETNDDWFEDVQVTGIKNPHLINIYRPVGVNTILSSLRNPTHDIRGDVPNPRFFVGPWNMSTIEPDMNIKGGALC